MTSNPEVCPMCDTHQNLIGIPIRIRVFWMNLRLVIARWMPYLPLFLQTFTKQKGSFVLDMRNAYRYALKKSTNEKQLLFVMVLALEEVSWPTVSSVFGKHDYHRERNPFEEVRDRSLSYLDVNFREQASNGRSKVFESVRKFGRPRQQFSDILDFSDPSLTSAERGERNSFCGDRYHFGQCLVLPKLCTLPPKGKHCRHKTSYFPAKSFPERERYEFKNHERALLTLPIKLISSREGFSSSDTNMFRWTEVTSENHSKNASFSHGENGSLNPKSRGRLEGRKDLGKFYDEDVEAQVDTRESRNFDDDDEFKDDFYRQSTLDGRRMIRGSDDIQNSEMRIYNIRENCRMKLRKEKEEKQCTEQSTMGGRTSEVVSDAEDEVWVQPQMRKIIGEKKQDLPRAKSTPDMLEGTVGRKLEVWPQREEPKRNGSMINVGDKNWQVYNDEQEADSLNEPNSFPEPVSLPELSGGAKSSNSRLASGKNFFGQFLNSRGSTPTEMSSNTEPFSQFWVSLSNIYGQALVVIMLALSLTEVMDNSVKLLSLQGAFLIYLYVGSIAVIICIYIWVLIDSCSSIQKSDSSGPITTNIIQGRDKELQNLSTTKFGSLKKAHISRDRTSNTSFYLRIGAIAFGLGTLVFNGLEMAMHSMMESSCLNDVIFVHPILHGLFTFLQMHFLFVNSQVLVERFGLTARFGFMHLAATNLALWIRLVIWESGNEWTYYVHLSQQDGVDYHSSDIPTPLQLRGFPKFLAGKEKNTMALGTSDNNVYQAVSKDHISQVVSLHECLNTNSLGRLWTSSMPFLYPFIIQFSLIAAAVTYIMGQNVAKNRLFFQKQKKMGESDKNLPLPTAESDVNAWNVDCGGASKGLFLGILCLVAGVVVIIIFLVVKENEDFPSETIFWLTMGMLLAILSVTVLMNVVGLIQVRKLSVTGTKLTALDKILSVVSVLGVQLYTILGIVVGASGIAEDATEGNASPEEKRHGMLLAVSVIQLLQSIMQNTFIVEGIRRTSLSRAQAVARPARQVVTFLIFSNAVLWVFDAFVIQSWISQELQLRFFGVLAWGALSRISLPLLVFFRFHSCVLLLEIWKKSYNSLHLDPGN